ncbi:hypothetical protein TNCV_2091191 [Trichonephila clavipes]|nr:hypothetical protein TNCV_2091191 [Trichonephila clavipes]
MLSPSQYGGCVPRLVTEWVRVRIPTNSLVPLKKVFNAQPIGIRRKGRPNRRWIDVLEKYLLVLTTKNWRTLAGRRLVWVSQDHWDKLKRVVRNIPRIHWFMAIYDQKRLRQALGNVFPKALKITDMHYRSHFSYHRSQRKMKPFTNTELADMHLIYRFAEENAQVEEILYRKMYQHRDVYLRIFALCLTMVLRFLRTVSNPFCSMHGTKCVEYCSLLKWGACPHLNKTY